MGIQKFITSLEQYGNNGLPEKKLSDKFIELVTEY